MNANKNNIFFILKLTILSYALTAIFILIFTLIVYKMLLPDNKITIGIIIIYTLSNLISGFVAGKIKGSKKFIWGILVGCTYFIVLIIVSSIISKEFFSNQAMILPALLSSLGGGMVGGMLS